MEISEMTQVTEDVLVAFSRLIPQLTADKPGPTRAILSHLAESSASRVFLARDLEGSGEIIGTATLVIVETPTRRQGWIEDVVVDAGARRRGVGRALTEACLEMARGLALDAVNLTSNPARTAANSLYQQMGFVQHETNLYRKNLLE